MTTINITYTLSHALCDASASAESTGWQKDQDARQAAYERQFYAAVFGREVSPAFIRYHKRMEQSDMEFRAARRKRHTHQRRVRRFKRKQRLLVN